MYIVKRLKSLKCVQVSPLLIFKFYFRPEDASKALEASQGKMFFGTKIKVMSHEGVSKYIVLIF